MANDKKAASAQTPPARARALVARVALRHGIPERDAARIVLRSRGRAGQHRFAPGWWLELLDAQLLTHIGAHPRVRCGDERRRTPAPGEPCHACGCTRGEYHVFGCDGE